MSNQQPPELSMVAGPDPEHLAEVQETIASYLTAVKANDIATLRRLFDAKANVAHYHVPSSQTRSTSS